jgi:septum formation protein
MIASLGGKTHTVVTGVTIRTAERSVSFSSSSEVTFRELDTDEIEYYVDTYRPFDKAGAYGIQGFCARYIKGIDGDYNNVVGLPVGRLYQEIKDWLP